MADYEITYYCNVNTSGSRYVYGTQTIPFSLFRYWSGDNQHKIAKIRGAIASCTVYRKTNSGAGAAGYSASIVCDGTAYTSTPVSANVNDAHWTGYMLSEFASFPTHGWSEVESIVFNPINANSGTSFDRYAIFLTIYYSDEEFLPTITGFSGNRYNATAAAPDDEGESMQYSFSLSVGIQAEDTQERSYVAFVVGDQTVHTFIDTNNGATIAQVNAFINGGTHSGVIQSSEYQFIVGNNYNVYLVFCYHGEIVSSIVFLPLAFANFWRSGLSTGGVAFGKFGASTQGSPLFESAYPGIFYAGIRGVNIYSADEIDTGGKWVDGSPIYRRMVTFSAATGTNQIAQSDGSDIEISGVDTVVRVDGVAQWSGDHIFVPLNFYAGAGQYTAVWTVGSPAKIYYSSSSACEITAVLYYTKEAI